MTEVAWFAIGVFVGAVIVIMGMLAIFGIYAHAVYEQEGRDVEEKLRIHPK